MEIGELLELLESEHVNMAKNLGLLQNAIQKRDLEEAKSILDGMDETLMQHFLDEEARLLRLIIQAFGREGAEESIEIFQEHIEIDSLVKKLRHAMESGSVSPEEVWRALNGLMEGHFGRESRTAFPCVREAARLLAGK